MSDLVTFAELEPAYRVAAIKEIRRPLWAGLVDAGHVTEHPPMPWALDSLGARNGGVAPVGRAIRAGQLVPISDPVVRENLEYFETVSRPLRLEDLPPEK